ncbi:MAG: hypothetical protein AAGH57_02665 [Pseudomonadota bacterium]
MFYFRAYGQFVESELALPEFPAISEKERRTTKPDVRILLRTLPPIPVEERNAGAFRVRDGAVDFEIEGTVRIRVASADCIEVDLIDPKRVREARLFVTGSAFGAWAYQRRRIPFHCGLVTKRDLGFAITGPSGVGKSTLTTALVESGYGFMSDDVVVFGTSLNGDIAITPSFPRIKLWQDAADYLSIETTALGRLHRDMDKFHVPFPPERVTESARLAAVFCLRFDDACDAPSACRLSLADAMRALRANIYRPTLAPALGLEDVAFNLIAAILQKVPVIELVRPRDFGAFDSTIEVFDHEVDRLLHSA